MFAPSLHHSWQRDYSSIKPVIETSCHETNNLNSEFVPDDQRQSRMINPISCKLVKPSKSFPDSLVRQKWFCHFHFASE